MNFQQLRIIRETVRQDFNLTEASAALYTSQSGVSKHIKDLEDIHITTKPSQGGKYVSVTVTFTAHNQEQLDNLYREISAHPDVLMAL